MQQSVTVQYDPGNRQGGSVIFGGAALLMLGIGLYEYLLEGEPLRLLVFCGFISAYFLGMVGWMHTRLTFDEHGISGRTLFIPVNLSWEDVRAIRIGAKDKRLKLGNGIVFKPARRWPIFWNIRVNSVFENFWPLVAFVKNHPQLRAKLK